MKGRILAFILALAMCITDASFSNATELNLDDVGGSKESVLFDDDASENPTDATWEETDEKVSEDVDQNNIEPTEDTIVYGTGSASLAVPEGRVESQELGEITITWGHIDGANAYEVRFKKKTTDEDDESKPWNTYRHYTYGEFSVGEPRVFELSDDTELEGGQTVCVHNLETMNNETFVFQIRALDEEKNAGEWSASFSNEDVPYSHLFDNTTYKNICFLDDAGNEIDKLTLAVAESKKVQIGLIKNDKDSTIIPLSSLKSYHDKYDNPDKGLFADVENEWNIYTTRDIEEYSMYNHVDRDLTYEVIDTPFTSIADFQRCYSMTFAAANMPKANERLFIHVWVHDNTPGGIKDSELFLPVEIEESGKSYEPTSPPILKTEEEVYSYIRKRLVNREDTRNIQYLTKDGLFNNGADFDFDAGVVDLFAEREGMKPYEGDYLRHSLGEPNKSVSQLTTFAYKGSVNFKGDHYTVRGANIPTITTKQQEEEIDKKIANLLAPGGALYSAIGKSDYEKVQAVYNYITKNVVDNIPSGDRTKPQYHSAYSALIKGRGTCEAFAVAFTRLTRELGVASKVVAGVDSAAHAYNIVEIKGYHPDGRNRDYWWFLDCSAKINVSDSSFKRAKEQSQFKDERYMQNYLNKVKGNEPKIVATVTNDENDDVQEFAYYWTIKANYLEKDAKENPERKYIVKLISSDGTFKDKDLDFGEYADRVTIDLNGKTVNISKDGADTYLNASMIRNGTLRIHTSTQINFGLLEPDDDWDENEELNEGPVEELKVNHMQFEKVKFTYVKSPITIQPELMFFGDVDIDENCSFENSSYFWFEIMGGGVVNVDCPLSASRLNISGTLKAKNLTSTNTRIWEGKTENLTPILISTGKVVLKNKIEIDGVNMPQLGVERYFDDNGALLSQGSLALSGNITCALNLAGEDDYGWMETKLETRLSIIPLDYVGYAKAPTSGTFHTADTVCTMSALKIKYEDMGSSVTVTEKNVDDYFYIPREPEDECVIRFDGSIVKVFKPSIRLSYRANEEAQEETFETLFVSLKECATQAKSFKNSAKGIYTVTFIEDSMLDSDVTLPSFMTGVEFKADISETSASTEHSVNLNGKTITASGSIRAYDGIHFVSGGALGTIKTTKKNASVLPQDYGFSFVFDNENSSPRSVLSNVQILASDSLVYLPHSNGTLQIGGPIKAKNLAIGNIDVTFNGLNVGAKAYIDQGAKVNLTNAVVFGGDIIVTVAEGQDASPLQVYLKKQDDSLPSVTLKGMIDNPVADNTPKMLIGLKNAAGSMVRFVGDETLLTLSKTADILPAISFDFVPESKPIPTSENRIILKRNGQKLYTAVEKLVQSVSIQPFKQIDSDDTLHVRQGESVLLSIAATPFDATYASVEWSIDGGSDGPVKLVGLTGQNRARIIGLKESGTATVTLTVDGKSTQLRIKSVPMQVVMHLDGGNVDGSTDDICVEHTYGKTLGNSLVVPVKENCVFAGWYTMAGGKGQHIYPTTPITDIEAVYASYLSAFDDANDNPLLQVAPINSMEYTGSTMKPAIQVFYGTKLLKEKTDYTVKFSNNKNAWVEGDTNYSQTKDRYGNYIKAPTVIVTGRGNYSGSVRQIFNITPKSIGTSGFNAEDLYLSYNKKTQRPTPSLLYNNKALKKNTDYTYAYEEGYANGFMEPGIYKVSVKGKGNYTGEKDVRVYLTNSIMASSFAIGRIASKEYTGEAYEPTLTVKYKKQTLKLGRDYKVAYDNNVNIGTATAIISGCGEYSGVKKVTYKITGKKISSAKVSGLSNAVYTGKEITQNPVLTVGETTLTENKDYKISYSANQNIGKATVTFTGMGLYAGTSMAKTFKISALPMYDAQKNTINDITVSVGEQATYGPKGAKPNVIVKRAGDTLVEGKDYTLSYKGNKAISAGDIPTASVTLTGIGNYSGTNTYKFLVNQQEISQTTIRVNDVAYSTKQGNYKSTPVVKDPDGSNLVLGTDFKVIYTDESTGQVLGAKDKVLADTVIRIQIVGLKKYAGQDTTKTYRVLSATNNIANATVKLKKTVVYTGEAITLSPDDFEVNIGDNLLTAGSEYVIDESSYTFVKGYGKGTASVVLKGKNTYGGQKKVSFTVGVKRFAS